MLIPSSCFATCRLGSRLAGPCSEFHQEQGQWREGGWHLPWFHRSLALCIASQSVPLRGKDSPSAQLGHQLREAQDGLLDLSSSSGVELLPIFEFDESQVPWTHPQTGEHLCQYWGYQTCGLVGLFGRVFEGVSRLLQHSHATLCPRINFETLGGHRVGLRMLDVLETLSVFRWSSRLLFASCIGTASRWS